jgi:hypothetical protein
MLKIISGKLSQEMGGSGTYITDIMQRPEGSLASKFQGNIRDALLNESITNIKCPTM